MKINGIAKLVLGPCHSQVLCDATTLEGLRKKYRFENDANKRERDRRISQYRYFIDGGGVFLTGLASRVHRDLVAAGIKVTIEDRRGIEGLVESGRVAQVIKQMPFQLRDYQLEAVAAATARPNGIIHIGTGGGKSIILTSLIEAWDKRTIIPLKSKDLMTQVRSDFAEYLGIPLNEVGQIGAGRFNPQEITVGLVNSLYRSKKALDYLSTVEVMVTDECHNGLSNMYDKVQRAATKASIRYGFSATPWQRKIKVSTGGRERTDMDLVGRFGPVIFRKSVGQLIEDGWLATPEVVLIENDFYYEGVDGYSGNDLRTYSEEYDDVLVKDRDRNKICCEISREFFEAGKKTLIFVSRLDHGRYLYDELIDYGIPEEMIGFANGQDILSRRKDVIPAFKSGDVKVLIGTEKILSEGLNFIIDACVHMLAGRSNGGVIQRIGRILRKPRGSSGDVDQNEHREVKFFEFKDDGHPYFAAQSRERAKVLRKEGFRITRVDYSDTINYVREQCL